MAKNILNFKEKININNELSVNLYKQMQKHSINEAELARRTHIPQPTLHKILSGKTEDPRFSTLQQLAVFFGLTVDELVSGIQYSGKQKVSSRINSIPIISYRDCLKGLDYIGKLSIKEWKEWLSIENAPSGAFGIGSTACAEPRFPRGTILIVDPNLIPKDGDLVIVQYKDAEEATLRELSIDGPNKLLLPLNPNFCKDVFDKSIMILGVVFEYRFSYVS